MHMSIMNVHGRDAIMRNTSAPVSQFQFQATLSEFTFGSTLWEFKVIGMDFSVCSETGREGVAEALLIRTPCADINDPSGRPGNGMPIRRGWHWSRAAEMTL